MTQSIYRLRGKIQHYAWGGYTFIPDLLGLSPRPGLPHAEYWMGAHPKAPADLVIEDGTEASLERLLQRDPVRLLGHKVARTYGTLPYLFKVLDVREMLSIQVHPTKPQAEAGFAREQLAGIPLDAPNRNYKDRNHKPELAVALSDSWLLHGFAAREQLIQRLESTPELAPFGSIFLERGYRGLYEHLMEMPDQSAHATLEAMARRLTCQFGNHEDDKSSPDYWAWRALNGGSFSGLDRGIFSIYVMNVVKLRAGEAIFQGAGVPHAYLEGQNVELMANSDNVLRGGLTEKHVDIPELLQTVVFEGLSPRVINAMTVRSEPVKLVYEAPVEDFSLSQLKLGNHERALCTARSLEILLCLSGRARVRGEAGSVNLSRGQSLAVFADCKYTIEAESDGCVLFSAAAGSP